MSTWTCPACGTVNAKDAPECASCGRWPSLFDLERTAQPDGAREASAAPVPEQTWVDIAAEGAAETPVPTVPPLPAEPPAEPREAEEVGEEPGRPRRAPLVRFLIWAVVIGAVVIPWLLDAIRG